MGGLFGRKKLFVWRFDGALVGLIFPFDFSFWFVWLTLGAFHGF
ncbi:unnamed protein product [Acidithrix sp. C25]|nr:unnamed protein product [Acidithrix sp. C25]